MNEKKEVYVQPALVKHELLRDITARGSGCGITIRCVTTTTP